MILFGGTICLADHPGVILVEVIETRPGLKGELITAEIPVAY